MSSFYNSNQYENAFHAHKIYNWEVPKHYKGSKWFHDHYEAAHPPTKTGFTQTIVEDNGHIVKDYPKPKTNPWGNFVGTWDMPPKLPGNYLYNPTGRRPDHLDRLRREAKDSQKVTSGHVKNQTRKGNNAPQSARRAPISDMDFDSPGCRRSTSAQLGAVMSNSRSGAEAPEPRLASQCVVSRSPIQDVAVSPVVAEPPTEAPAAAIPESTGDKPVLVI